MLPQSENRLSRDKVLVEGDVMSQAGWCARLDMTTYDFQTLCSINAIKRATYPSKSFRLDFVGLLSVGKDSFFVLPKVFEDSPIELEKKDLLATLRCIQHYQKRRNKKGTHKFPMDSSSFFSEGGSLLNLFLGLHAWSTAHGLHVNDIDTTIDEPDHVDWKATFDKSLLIHGRTGLSFSETFGSYRIKDPSDLAIAQAVAVTSLFDDLQIVTQLWISEFDPLIAECREFLSQVVPECKSQKMIRQYVDSAERDANKDHERDLVSFLKLWLSGIGSSSTGPILYGVNAFHVIWEDMCRVVLGMGGEELSHTEVASQPWFAQPGEVRSLGSQRPDFIHVLDDKLILADAKWYRQWRGEVPQVPDVVKQVMYELTVSREQKVGANAFLLPSIDLSNGSITSTGSVVFLPVTGSISFPPVAVVSVNWNAAVGSYLKDTGIPDILQFLLDQRDAATRCPLTAGPPTVPAC